MGWGEGASVLLAIALTLAFVFSSGSGVLSTFAVGISFTASCAAVAHPLLIQTLIPSALIAIWLLTAVRLIDRRSDHSDHRLHRRQMGSSVTNSWRTVP
jgi:hypothetical protein